MKVFEEYFKRHNIHVPLVHYCKLGHVVLFSKKYGYKIGKIFWVNQKDHPGYYTIDFLVPARNSFYKSSIFEERNLKIQKTFNDYENFVFEWAKAVAIGVQENEMIIYSQEESYFALWEILAFVCDDWFVKQSQEIKTKLFSILDKDNSLAKRHKNSCELTDYLFSANQSAARIWRYELLEIYQNYSDWFYTLVQSLEKKNGTNIQ
jgi:hypothetical protein